MEKATKTLPRFDDFSSGPDQVHVCAFQRSFNAVVVGNKFFLLVTSFLQRIRKDFRNSIDKPPGKYSAVANLYVDMTASPHDCFAE